MSFLDDIGSAASSVGSAIGGAVEDVAGAVGDAAGAVGNAACDAAKAVGGAAGDVVDGAVDLFGKLPDPIQDALKAMSLYAVAVTPGLGLAALAAGAAGGAVVPHIPVIVAKLEGQDLKAARADRHMAQFSAEKEKAMAEKAEEQEDRKMKLNEKEMLAQRMEDTKAGLTQA